MHLLLLVPLDINGQALVHLQLMRMPRTLGKEIFGSIGSISTNDISNLLPWTNMLTPRDEPQGDLDVWLLLRIRIVLRIFGETFRNDELLHIDLALVHLLALVQQKLMYPLKGLLLIRLHIQDLHQDRLAHFFRQSTPITSDDVQAFEFCFKGLLLPIDHLHRRIFLFLQQHQTHKDSVNLNFESLVPLVHRSLDLFSDLHRLLEIRRLRVHENRIGVTINHIKRQLLVHNVDGRLQSFSTLRCDERS
mmetsp:Transcript_48710/g.106084  ORF Transcript_48710/g.106084 Transcript_48710/m.106084 type:complete len:248 (+) Transcript_48710:737-1480(+)